MVSRNLPPVFATVYDEFWELFHHFSVLCRPILGEEPFLPPSIWIWYLNQNQEDAGFPPHRDRPDLRPAPGELPKSMTVWAPLTDATPLNGCMYIVPAYLDEGYLKDNDTITPELHNVRALPAPAGSALLWNQRMLHWGGKSSQRATTRFRRRGLGIRTALGESASLGRRVPLRFHCDPDPAHRPPADRPVRTSAPRGGRHTRCSA